jgi:hypothetical protein
MDHRVNRERYQQQERDAELLAAAQGLTATGGDVAQSADEEPADDAGSE